MQNLPNYNGPTIKSQGAFHGAAGDGKIGPVDVRDIAAVAVKTLTEPGYEGKAYNLSGPEALTHAQIAEKITSAAGRKVSYVDLAPDQLKQGLVGAGVPDAYDDAMLDLHAFYKRGEAGAVTGNVRRITGRDPITFDQFAKDHAKEFRS